MATEVLESLIDFEIRPLIKSLNELSFLQTAGCCSGWTGKDGISDGVMRIWNGQPYIYLSSLNDIEMIKFIKYIAKGMIFDRFPESKDRLLIYTTLLSTADLIDDGKQLIHLALEYRNDNLLFIIHVNDFERTPEYIQKIWGLLLLLVNKYKE